MNSPFERTTCSCETCVSCCKRQPGPLRVGDFERIATFMKLSLSAAMPFFRASPGALVQSIGQRPRWVRTITPASDDSGRCVFLDPNDRCMIHPVAPFGCAMFDMHMGPREAQERAVWYIREIEGSDEYARMRARLEPARSYRPVSTEERT